jgi:signal transduction histidine kinase
MSGNVWSGRWRTLGLSALVAVLFLAAGNGSYTVWMTLSTWAAVCLAAGSLWHRAPDEITPISMAPAAYLAALVVLPPFASLGVVAGSSLLGGWLWRRESTRDVLFETGSSVLASLGGLFTLLVLGSWIRFDSLVRAPVGFLTVAAAGLVMMALYQGALSAAAAHGRGVTWGRAWWESFGRETGLVTTGALLIVAALAVFGAQTLGLRGILLSAMPALFVLDGSRRNIELGIAQSRLIKNERLAAKGEMAAEIGHELNNYLAAISGRAQLLLRKLEGDTRGVLGIEAERVRSLAMGMAELSRGLMECSRSEVRRESVGVNELVERTVDFVKPQRRFRDLEFRLEPDPALPRVEMDPGQIQQVLLILLGQVSERPGGCPGVLRLRTFGTSDREVGIEIGSPRSPASGEPLPEQEEGPAIETVRRILGRHHGRLELSSEPESPATYRVLLPAA